MSITTTQLTRAAGVSAIVAGLLFIAVQVNHPHLDLALLATTEWVVRESMKLCFAVLALIGITGMYLSQTRKAGVLGLVGYLILGAGFLILFTVQVVGVFVLPTIAQSAPGYASDALAVFGGGQGVGIIGPMKTFNLLGGLTYVAGGLVFGIALFRANVLARWASALLAMAAALTLVIPFLPWINPRFFAVPTGVALIGLGYSLWRETRTRPVVASEAGALLTSVVQ